MFLEGRNEELLTELNAQMESASSTERYEVAAQCRDTIRTIETLRDRQQKMASPRLGERDVFGIKVGSSGGLIQIFQDVEIIPGISSVQIAASKARVPLDKSKVITMHISTPIEEEKLELQKALIDGYSVVLVPRPWPNQPEKHFMPSEIAKYLKRNGFDTSKLKVHVYEAVTTENEASFEGTVDQLEEKEFSDLSVMVFNQSELESYVDF